MAPVRGKRRDPANQSAARQRISLNSVLAVGDDRVERCKFIGITVLAVGVLAFFCYHAYEMYVGPEVRLLDRID